MLKRVLQFVSYLIISLSFGLLVIIISGNIGIILQEKKVRQATKLEIKNAISAFKDSAPDATPDQTINFLRKFTASVMKEKVIALDPAQGKKPDRDEFKHLFTFSEGGKNIDLYIKNEYVRDEIFDLDSTELIEGVFSTIIVFTAIIIYTEKRRRALIMQQQFETKHEALKKALEENEALALLGRMTATLAHELKTPIATISNLVHVLPSRISDEHFTKRFDTLLKEELNRIQQLIDNLLIYGKEIAIKDVRWIRLKPFIKELSDAIGIEISSCPDVDIYADRFYMRLFFENLIRNSLQAGADRASIKIRIPPSKEDRITEILYEDNGIGFPEGCDLDELITPFVTHRSRGAGLGLFLAQKIALAHGGTISLYRLTKGAGIRISMPQESMRLNEQP